MKKVEWTLEIYMPSVQIIMRKRLKCAEIISLREPDAGATLLASRELFRAQICKLGCSCIPWWKSGMVMSVFFISLLQEWSFTFQEQWETSTSAENNMQSFNADSWETTRNELIKSCYQHNQDQFPLLISSAFSCLALCSSHAQELWAQTNPGRVHRFWWWVSVRVGACATFIS